MSDKELEEYINKIEPNFDSHLEKGTIEMSNEYYNLLEEKMVRLINKNQELKNSINALQKELNEENLQCSKYAIENQKLKKQLEELESTNKVLSHELTKDKVLQQDCLTTCCGIPIGDIPKLINQQKEFIKYLEDEIKRIKENDIYQPLQKMALATHEHTLQKYKSIIGNDK